MTINNSALMANDIKGSIINAPIWGGHRKAFLSTWSEIKKLGFKKRDRSFGFIENENGTTTQALYFYAAMHCCSLSDEQLSECRHEWYITTETLDQIED